MNLFEFFGKIDHNINQENIHDPNKLGKEEERQLSDQLFWYILDHDNFHKKFFMPAANEIKKTHKKDKESTVHSWKIWLPMVNAACAEYYKKNDVKGDPKETFNKQFRIELCKRLVEHYHKDILNGEYELGH